MRRAETDKGERGTEIKARNTKKEEETERERRRKRGENSHDYEFSSTCELMHLIRFLRICNDRQQIFIHLSVCSLSSAYCNCRV